MSYNSYRLFNNRFNENDLADCYENINLLKCLEAIVLVLFLNSKLNGTTLTIHVVNILS
jgi:hypothetical protein